MRTRKRREGAEPAVVTRSPFGRNTVSRDWHKAALQDAALRDMALHSLRRTAAAAWLAGRQAGLADTE